MTLTLQLDEDGLQSLPQTGSSREQLLDCSQHETHDSTVVLGVKQIAKTRWGRLNGVLTEKQTNTES